MMLFQGIFKAHVDHDCVCHWAIASLINFFLFYVTHLRQMTYALEINAVQHRAK